MIKRPNSPTALQAKTWLKIQAVSDGRLMAYESREQPDAQAAIRTAPAVSIAIKIHNDVLLLSNLMPPHAPCGKEVCEGKEGY
ncbi:MAG: hypothetical protein JRH18_21090 [Deltaproteobacteria bacterium]|nr:hypothetical protein [Deltaproteobacteria bacterium]MBW1996302.1 hypothetical protein [Deltaproteobacteria bacterium]MBW2154148.1 hypothetical protein [Deltaproteobacteria bacterium]